ncbi:MAG: hypothetical protein ACOY3Z_07000 [Thermodesulfobacteriota bacterium]
MKPRLALLLLLSLSIPQVAQASQDQCGATLDNRCQVCHSKNRVCEAIGAKKKADWQRTVKNMIKKGALVSAAEEQILVDCLAGAKPGEAFACK